MTRVNKLALRASIDSIIIHVGAGVAGDVTSKNFCAHGVICAARLCRSLHKPLYLRLWKDPTHTINVDLIKLCIPSSCVRALGTLTYSRDSWFKCILSSSAEVAHPNVVSDGIEPSVLPELFPSLVLFTCAEVVPFVTVPCPEDELVVFAELDPWLDMVTALLRLEVTERNVNSI
jgi:hypothetical protein